MLFGDYEITREYKSLTISKEIIGLNVALAFTNNDRDVANSNFDKDITTLSVSKSFQFSLKNLDSCPGFL